MQPTLQDGEHLLGSRIAYFHFDLNAMKDIMPGQRHATRNIVYPFGKPRRGDIIVFRPPLAGSNKSYIKRVVALPGDKIAIPDDHKVYINDRVLDEPYIAEEPRYVYPPNCHANACEFFVPPDEIFVLGDNRNNSADSHIFDAVPIENMSGEIIVVY